ncbi:3-oxoacyl-[acyl-carrier-protein] reductase [Alkalihalobacillus sp. MEB130]|uniref:3-oxoacyl-[acyl-carrier-protein] reductase n=1 Tax=Alkalihalobacillus sp. MEB130 TaxID=2976704 RepID=UPI0028E02D73|nr:3-oxoacyl-[acyl-carrier-protein] reductase [Alkalihalobacillus sp. MEB130]MDT8860152.1 3-oxoacyl-[acyl-carrier-protein] reductase [Alkalihalobacillus sp. MEB130]
MRLKDKVAIITGASRGIGEATARKFALEGAKLVLVDLKKDEVDRVSQIIKDLNGESIGIDVDVTDREEVENLMKKTIHHYGRIDVVINNAGITQDATLVKMTEQQWDSVIDVNLKGVFNVAQEAAKIMIEQKSGVILNASSVVGLYGNFGQTNYAASKWGVNGMTKSWAKELGKHGIRVNAIAPGFIATPMVDKMPDKVKEMMRNKSVLNRMGKPEDIANGYAFLASDEAEYITGTVLSIDGGTVI